MKAIATLLVFVISVIVAFAQGGDVTDTEVGRTPPPVVKTTPAARKHEAHKAVVATPPFKGKTVLLYDPPPYTFVCDGGREFNSSTIDDPLVSGLASRLREAGFKVYREKDNPSRKSFDYTIRPSVMQTASRKAVAAGIVDRLFRSTGATVGRDWVTTRLTLRLIKADGEEYSSPCYTGATRSLFGELFTPQGQLAASPDSLQRMADDSFRAAVKQITAASLTPKD